MKNLKRIGMLAIAAIAATTGIQAQEYEAATTISADLVNQYIWRGQDLGDVSLQPTLGVAYKGLSVTAWGNVGLSDKDDTKEFDLTAAYTVGGFNVGVTDYWFNNGPDARYFMYKAHQTAHVFEGNVGYNFGVCSLQWFTNFAGNDGLNKNGKRAYSSYVELAAPFKLGGYDFNAAIGAVPYRTTYYSNVDGFAITNVSVKCTKDLKISDSFSVPVFAAINTNPCTQKAYFVVGFTLRP